MGSYSTLESSRIFRPDYSSAPCNVTKVAGAHMVVPATLVELPLREKVVL